MYGKDADYAMTGNTNTVCSNEDIDDVTAAINGLLDKLTVGGPGDVAGALLMMERLAAGSDPSPTQSRFLGPFGSRYQCRWNPAGSADTLNYILTVEGYNTLLHGFHCSWVGR
ncbi:MAG: hypothetical protein H6512_08555 [Acidimicrobiia bacterium]|nr:hypothetical protein [Acidimicrobiia bacterium]